MKKKIFTLSNFFFFIAFLILLAIPLMKIYNDNKGMAKIKSFETMKIEKSQDERKENILEAQPYAEDTKYDEIVGTINIPKIYEKIGIYDNETQENLDKGVAIYGRFIVDKEGNRKRVAEELSLDPKLNKNIEFRNIQAVGPKVGNEISYTNQDIFLNITKLEKGDKFEINNGKNILEYEVCNIMTVLPDEVNKMYEISEKNPNENYSSLVTCVPARINTHRLIVQGKLINTKQLEDASKVEGKNVIEFFNNLDLLNQVSIGALLLAISTILIITLKKIYKKIKERKNVKS
mgnify:CR=1 FL=1